MKDVQKVNLRDAREWLAGEIEIRMPRALLGAGAVMIVALFIIAFD